MKYNLKVRKCKSCGEKFQQIKPMQYVCNLFCAVNYQKLLKEKKAKQDWREKKKVLQLKTKNWKNELQRKINEIVRLLDKGLPCLATGRESKQVHAGHVFARGGNQSMRFNLHNIHRQSAQSNHFQNDDGLLREGIVKEYGQEYMNFISELRRTPTLKYTNEQYHEFYVKASGIANSLKKINFTYELSTRIIMRTKINQELEIYQDEFCKF